MATTLWTLPHFCPTLDYIPLIVAVQWRLELRNLLSKFVNLLAF